MIPKSKNLKWTPDKLFVLADCIKFVSRRLRKQPINFKNKEINMVVLEFMNQLNISSVNKGGVRQKLATIFSDQTDKYWGYHKPNMVNHIKIRYLVRTLLEPEGYLFPKIRKKSK